MESRDDEVIIPISEWPVTETLSNTPRELTKVAGKSSSNVDSQKVWTGQHQIPQQQLVKAKQTHTDHQKETMSQSLTYDCKEPLCKKSKSEHTEFGLNSSQIEADDYNETLISHRGEPRLIKWESEPLADTRVARWWRSHSRRHTEPLPLTSNPHTLLFHISR